ncbi:MAG TPA: DinB family protein [Acidobacteriaceae bacterium]|nr:DinB family protein [Acidobacteriaceae bacterium]
MTTAAITLEELLADNQAATRKWQAWFATHPAALDVPCSIYNSGTVRGLLKHIFAVELRHSQRLNGEEVTSYEAIPVGSLDELMAVHAQSTQNLRNFLSTTNDAALLEVIPLQTVSAGTVYASRRKLFAHILLHSTRHWAQLSSLLREAGYKTEWAKDFLFSEAME